MLSFGEYRPDVSDFRGNHSILLTNVLPRGDGYGPIGAFSQLSSALAAACRGLFFARKSDGSVAIFAGTSTKIYLMDNTDYTWDDVSKALGSYTALSASKQWSFAQYGNNVVAVQENVAPQVFTLGSSTEFADLGGSPPQAAYASVVNSFLVLSGLLNNPFRIQWSALEDITGWTAGTNSSDFQDFGEGGIVRGVSGGETGLIFQDGTIRRMTYAPGSPLIFQIDRVTRDIGLYAPLSLCQSNSKVMFLASQGFMAMDPTGYPAPIGREKVDRTFLAEYDSANSQLMIGVPDPKSTRVFWCYKTTGGTSGQFDKVLCYDIVLERWTRVSLSGEFIAPISQPGDTLEGLDSVSGSIDALTQSLDSFASAVTPEIGVVDTSHKVGFLRGANLEATMQTPEQSGESENRIYVRGVKPITDAATVYAAVTARETPQASATTGAESAVDSLGWCRHHVSTRYARSKVRIPASTAWTYCTGVEPDFTTDGER